MIELNMLNAAVDCQVGEDGVRHLIVVDPVTKIVVHTMLQEESAKDLATLLLGSGIVIAKDVPARQG